MTERENILIDALISAGHIAEQARTAMEKLKAENAKLRYRAEVAERALGIIAHKIAIIDLRDISKTATEKVKQKAIDQAEKTCGG